MVGITEVFEAEPTSVGDFMRKRGQGFYVPAYQRLYTWDNTHINRLFDDTGHGLTQLLQRPDAITFIGTLITIHDTDYTTVNPIVRRQVPSRVMTVIDGQQRLTTLLLLNSALHDELRRRHRRFASPDDEATRWLHERCLETIQMMLETLEEDMSHGDGDYRFYPRMTRAYDDQWSRRAGEARYRSPIAHFLHEYGTHVRSGSQGAFHPSGSDPIPRRFEHIRRTIRRAIALGESDEVEMPSTRELVDSDRVSSALFNEPELPTDVVGTVDGADGEHFGELLRVLMFARFVLDRVAVTVVTAKGEDYAFDMFDALNTTGEPLTAIETFRTRVIESEGLDSYRTSDSRSALRYVEEYLDRYGRAADRQRAASELLVPFSLAESGRKLSKRLNDQRREMRDRYDELETIDQKRQLVWHLAHTSLFVHHAWKWRADQGPSLPGVAPVLDPDERMCLAVLRAANHHIVIAPLARFYSAVRTDTSDRTRSELGNAVRAATAFFALWRGARGGTSGIDARYRQLMSRGHPELGIPALARRSDAADSASEPPRSDELCRFFRWCLEEEGLGTKSAWVAAAKNIPIYRHSQPLARFLLLAAFHDSVADESNPGLVKVGRPRIMELLTFGRWTDEANLTVEHIAPRTPGGSQSWRSSLYEDPDTIDRLGNLALLPHEENVRLGNQGWQVKRAVYRVLSARSADEAEAAWTSARDAGLPVDRSILERTEYLPVTAGLGDYTADWDVDIVERRSERLSELAWDRVAPWLGL